jgi:hypothetical protein
MSSYFGVIGNRDYIKIDGRPRPYWEFLDEQPAGWLTSLAYAREDLPPRQRMIFDCGAWSYRAEAVPQLRGERVTAGWAFRQYLARARPGDYLIAPDHMLIGRYGNLEERRRFNRRSAAEFLELVAGTDFEPVVTAHGVDLAEKVENARWLADLGYEAIALGGLAGRASAKADNIAAVEAIRAELPWHYLHVLGLSSPDYAGQWSRLGINSFDGSSHFKQAFTAGIYFMEQDGELVRHKAARTERGRPDRLLEPITAPRCDCRACEVLRRQGVDTRTYGSNENNMGRAAHNQNMLMRAHRRQMEVAAV